MKKVISSALVAVLFLISLFSFSGCAFFMYKDDIGSVREEAKKQSYEISAKFVTAFKEKDGGQIKELFCEKSKDLPELDTQITYSLSFMQGEISEYKFTGLSGESYSSDYGRVDEFSYGSSVIFTMKGGRRYELNYNVYYKIKENTLKGLTNYVLAEDTGEEGFGICRAGYPWDSPYDAECGVLAAQLIKAIASGDKAEVKSLLCASTLALEQTDGQIELACAFFKGAPVFNERADGLYNASDSETDIYIRVFNYEAEKDSEGNLISLWINAMVTNVCTDAEESYRLDFVAYIINANDESKKGVSMFTVEDFTGKEEQQVGAWLQ